MRLKGRYVPDRPKIAEIDCGMGMKELKAEIREIQAITMLPRCMTHQPAWKKPVIIASLAAAAITVSVSVLLFGIAPMLFGALIIIGLAWMAFVGYANR